MTENRIEIKEDALASLEAVLYQFVQLYERFGEDRQSGVKCNAEIGRLVQQFSSHLHSFSQLEQKVQQQMSAAAVDAIAEAAQQLRQAAQQASQVLEAQQKKSTFSQLSVFALSLLGCVLGSVAVVWLLMPDPTLPLTDAQFARLEKGRDFEKVYPKLTKQERAQIAALLNEK